MYRLFLITFMVLIFSNSNLSLAYEKEIKGLSSTMAENIIKGGKKTIAVVDFTDLQGNVTELGRFLAEELSVNLTTMAKGFEVIDRTHLKSILSEHKLSMSGLVDPKTVKQLGKIAGVDAIVTGSITPFGDSIRVSAKVIATETAKVIGASSGDIAKTKAIEELLAKGIETAAPVSKDVVSPAPKPELKAQQKVEVNNFLFELQSCKISGQQVTCHFMVNNKDVDRNLNLYADEHWGGTSRIFDDLGNVYKAEESQIGNSRARQYAQIMLVSGIPTKASLRFGGVSQEVRSIALLEISCSTDKYFKAQFRNIPLSK